MTREEIQAEADKRYSPLRNNITSEEEVQDALNDGFVEGAEWMQSKADDLVKEAISGIVLTAEMLKANGFSTSNEHWYYKRVRENGVFDICVSLDYKEIEITKVCGVGTDDEEADYGLSIDIGRGDMLVHKFQQILLIYDLFDLATNFKIS